MSLMTWAKLALTISSCAAPCLAQDAVMQNLKPLVNSYMTNMLEGAEKMKESDYGFKPSGDVRSFREQLGHVADANYSICSGLNGEANPNKESFEKKNAGKAELIGAVRGSFDYCTAAMDAASDTRLAETVKRGSTERAKAYFALHLLDHTALHYGNMITYMRIKGIVPPETERRQQAAPKK